jgi:hypothetical protein
LRSPVQGERVAIDFSSAFFPSNGRDGFPRSVERCRVGKPAFCAVSTIRERFLLSAICATASLVLSKISSPSNGFSMKSKVPASSLVPPIVNWHGICPPIQLSFARRLTITNHLSAADFSTSELPAGSFCSRSRLRIRSPVARFMIESGLQVRGWIHHRR